MMTIRKILVANRGEIAIRVMRACEEMGIATVAVYSEVDENAYHVRYAHEAWPLGGKTPAESYLRMDKIIEIAKKSGADAVHPGYGFLSENYEFARRCGDEGVIFIGPPADAIRRMGLKIESKRIMEAAGVPVIPGYFGDDQSDERLAREAERIGFPLMVKASAGGGGKGLRIVNAASDLAFAIDSVRSEARKAFGNDSLFLEKFIAGPRHIEFQIFGDTHGNMFHLNERECSIQRRHQKIIEETPSVVMDEALRREMGAIAVKAGKAVGYVGAGTVEFMLDEKRNYYFLEMNTRLQVEHPITELTTGIDLVKLQIRVAAGEQLDLPDYTPPRGHAIECRVYAEDPGSNFLPSTGKLLLVHEPRGVNIRVDSGIETGDEISVYYDPMIAKLVVFDANRADAIRKAIYALENYAVLGVRTNMEYLKSILRTDEFRGGDYTTTFVDSRIAAPATEPGEVELIGIAIAELLSQGGAAATADGETLTGAWRKLGHWRNA